MTRAPRPIDGTESSAEFQTRDGVGLDQLNSDRWCL
jgi:hypothetical protein